ncbi:MAG TPA: response regulator [Acidimicrobiales bacterium]|nr:response regulator [Acidimicrobiales bacterium]
MSTEIMSATARRVVLVDSRDNRRELMRLVVRGDDARAILVGEADCELAALAVVDRERADTVVVDIQMPIPEGLATVAALRKRFPDLGIVACSFDLDPSTVQRVLAEGADTCLAKPVNRTDIHKALAALPPQATASERIVAGASLSGR